jgi:hypothetical protein
MTMWMDRQQNLPASQILQVGSRRQCLSALALKGLASLHNIWSGRRTQIVAYSASVSVSPVRMRTT